MKNTTIHNYISAAALLLSAFACTVKATPPPGYTLIWQDNFDGTNLNTANWTVGLRDPATGNLVPGAQGAGLLNNAYAGYITPEDVIVSGGTLTLLNQKRTYQGTDPAGTYQYTSGWVMSMHKVHFNKGYVEFRAQFPSGTKVWPALWLIPENLTWPPEIDMWEYFGFRSDFGYDVMMNVTDINGSWYGNHISNFNALYNNAAWHTYGFQWTTTQMIWTLDGVVTTVVNKSGLSKASQRKWPNEDFYFVLNNGVKTDSPDQTNWPNSVIIDYVSLYQ